MVYLIILKILIIEGDDNGADDDLDGDGISDDVEDYIVGIIGGDRDIAIDTDSDGDGVPDHIEVLIGTDLTDPLSPADTFTDSDGDGVPDYVEKLVTGIESNNPISNGSTPDASVDSDGDGVPDWVEYLSGSQPNDSNSIPGGSTSTLDQLPVTAGQIGYAAAIGILPMPLAADTDSDADGYPDYLEIRHGMNLRIPGNEVDDDNDGLPNQIEAWLSCHSSNTGVSCSQSNTTMSYRTDSDNDGVSDLREFQTNTNPFDSASFIVASRSELNLAGDVTLKQQRWNVSKISTGAGQVGVETGHMASVFCNRYYCKRVKSLVGSSCCSKCTCRQHSAYSCD